LDEVLAATEEASLQAQYLVCQRLVRACRQAMYEMALDEDDDQNIRRLAIQAMKGILDDWTEAQKSLRREMESRQILQSVNAG
jgi:hypothetical protein